MLVSVAHGQVATPLATSLAFMLSNAVVNSGAPGSKAASYRQKVPAATADLGQMQFEVELEKVASIEGD